MGLNTSSLSNTALVIAILDWSLSTRTKPGHCSESQLIVLRNFPVLIAARNDCRTWHTSSKFWTVTILDLNMCSHGLFFSVEYWLHFASVALGKSSAFGTELWDAEIRIMFTSIDVTKASHHSPEFRFSWAEACDIWGRGNELARVFGCRYLFSPQINVNGCWCYRSFPAPFIKPAASVVFPMVKGGLANFSFSFSGLVPFYWTLESSYGAGCNPCHTKSSENRFTGLEEHAAICVACFLCSK